MYVFILYDLIDQINLQNGRSHAKFSQNKLASIRSDRVALPWVKTVYTYSAFNLISGIIQFQIAITFKYLIIFGM